MGEYMKVNEFGTQTTTILQMFKYLLEVEVEMKIQANEKWSAYRMQSDVNV